MDSTISITDVGVPIIQVDKDGKLILPQEQVDAIVEKVIAELIRRFPDAFPHN